MSGTADDALFGDGTLTDAEGGGRATLPDVISPHLFVAMECGRPEAGGSRHSLANIDRVLVGRGAARSAERLVDGGTRTLNLRIPDPRMSSRHACFSWDRGACMVLDTGSRNGTRVNGLRVSSITALADGDIVEVGHTLLIYRPALTAPLDALGDVDFANDDATNLLATVDPFLKRSVSILSRLARSNCPVLLLGETGTGKEVVARGLHRLSERKGPFVAVNCGALPATLLEAQFFGHVRGAFSGAVADAPGLLRSADGGTILLDEIADLPMPSQAALLRVLQDHEVVPVGGTRPIKVDLRVLAATHQPLRELVARGEFREDLFARVSAFSFALPPLRARREDIGLMVAAYARGQAIRLTPAAGRMLFEYDWPRNVRQLHQVLQVASALAGKEPIDVVHLRAPMARSAPSAANDSPPDAGLDPVQERLIASLKRHRGNISQVARELGKARMQVQRWMRRFGIDSRSFR
ncbi:MAG TPA: sigma 54-interacting transcriptional regulator [Polyangiaceae bacterium]|nr:sigma 54-interacting transcriptional regulator [Polyangiaceae bacterium]